MVPRCAYYLNDKNEIIRHSVLIEWELGFTKEAKHQYINRILEALSINDKILVDVTSASYICDAQHLSPIFVKMKNNTSLSVEDYISSISNVTVQLTQEAKINLFGYIYLSNFTEKEIRTIKKYDGFFDVFLNHMKNSNNTQAYFCALYKLMLLQRKTDVLESFDSFIEYIGNTKIVDVV